MSKAASIGPSRSAPPASALLPATIVFSSRAGWLGSVATPPPRALVPVERLPEIVESTTRICSWSERRERPPPPLPAEVLPNTVELAIVRLDLETEVEIAPPSCPDLLPEKVEPLIDPLHSNIAKARGPDRAKSGPVRGEAVSSRRGWVGDDPCDEPGGQSLLACAAVAALLAPSALGAPRAGSSVRSFGENGFATQAFGTEPSTGGAKESAPMPDGGFLIRTERGLVGRYLADGSLDAGFGEDGYLLRLGAQAIATTADGRIYLLSGSGSEPRVLWRLLADGSPDSSSESEAGSGSAPIDRSTRWYRFRRAASSWPGASSSKTVNRAPPTKASRSWP